MCGTSFSPFLEQKREKELYTSCIWQTKEGNCFNIVNLEWTMRKYSCNCLVETEIKKNTRIKCDETLTEFVGICTWGICVHRQTQSFHSEQRECTNEKMPRLTQKKVAVCSTIEYLIFRFFSSRLLLAANYEPFLFFLFRSQKFVSVISLSTIWLSPTIWFARIFPPRLNMNDVNVTLFAIALFFPLNFPHIFRLTSNVWSSTKQTLKPKWFKVFLLLSFVCTYLRFVFSTVMEWPIFFSCLKRHKCLFPRKIFYALK